jgi:methylenetetrahydrofolate/methylenetetrahydromethanopterin dehydrogenase (NADP+)
MSKKKILIQIDTDIQPSAFDRVVAMDSGADEVFSYGGVRMEQLQGLVHGAIFTRGASELAHTALFIGGSDLGAGDFFLNETRKHMLPQFGLQVSIMLDSSGANTTAAAAIRLAAKHIDLASSTVLILGGTGPVGQRVARLLARVGATVRIGSRQKERADSVATVLKTLMPTAKITAVSTASATDGPAALVGVNFVIAAGAAGVVLLPKKIGASCATLRLAMDLNAVPPAGIEGIEPNDFATERDNVVCYGALGIGGPKMKIHRACIGQLFTRNDLVLDAEQIYEIGATA